MLNLRRFPAARALRTARTFASAPEGPETTGNPKGFNKRERASEDYYILQHEKEQIQKLSKEIAERQKQIEDLKKQASERK